jgi:putative transposase
MRYIEGNPVRAGLASRASAYPWSSYGSHAEGAADPVLSDHRLYRDLGATAGKRQRSYRDLFKGGFEDGFLNELRAATNGGWGFGTPAFQRRIAAASGRRVTPLPRGRPRKARAAPKRRKRR